MNVVRLGETPTGDHFDVDLDLPSLVGSHLAAIANSGGGKSKLLQVLLEQTQGQIQQIIMDVEDSFSTLRERGEYVILGGEGADGPAPLGGARGLALAAMEHGFSLIVQLNDMGGTAADYVAAFVEGMMAAPRAHWHPVLFVLDEAQFLIGEFPTAALEPLRDLAYRGRKRGYTMILASLRLAKAIDPAIRGMVNNWLIGRSGTALDRKAMAEQLGFEPGEGRRLLAQVQARQFYALGPALASSPTLFDAARPETTMVERGQQKPPTPPAPEALRDLLASLAPPPAPAPASVSTSGQPAPAEGPAYDAARVAEIESLRLQLVETTRSADANQERAIECRNRLAGVVMAARRAVAELEDAVSIALGKHEYEIEEPSGSGESTPQEPGSTDTTARLRSENDPVGQADTAEQALAPAGCDGPEGNGKIPGGTGRVLAILAGIFPAGMTKDVLALQSGIKARGSTMSSYLSQLRQAGFLTVADGKVMATAEGAAAARAAGDIETPPAPGPDLVRWWAGKVKANGATVDYLLRWWPGMMTRADLAERLGINPRGSTLSSYLSVLRTANMLEEQDGKLRLSPSVMGKPS